MVDEMIQAQAARLMNDGGEDLLEKAMLLEAADVTATLNKR